MARLPLMTEFRTPAFYRNGDLVTLIDVLSVVRPSQWSWRLLNFEGTLKSESDLNLLDIEAAVCDQPDGIAYSWESLLRFAGDVDQPIDVTLVALDDRNGCVLVIEVRDSTYWRILSDPSDTHSMESGKRISRLA